MTENKMQGVYGQSKLAFHSDKLAALAENKITSPIYVRFKPTNRCNHRCFYCAYDPEFEYVLSETINRTDELPREKTLETLDDFKEMGVKAITFSGGGEPLIYTHINETLKRTLENGLELSIITNGQRLDNERAEYLSQAEWVRVSTESMDVETFEKARRVSPDMFHKLQENMRNFAKIKKPDCEFGVNFVISNLNADKCYDSAKYFKDMGFNHIKFSPLYTPRDFESYHAPFREGVIGQIKRSQQDLSDDQFKVFSTYEGDFELACLDHRTYPRCFMNECLVVVAADSNVYTCQDKAYSESGFLGSIKDQSFRELWFSDELRERIRSFDPRKQCNHHCTKHTRNIEIAKMIGDLDNLDQYKPKLDRHKNFI